MLSHATRVATAPQVEEQRRRAEQDKLAAIIDLERLSRDLLQEKKEKRKLEARIREMNSQLLVGGVVDTQVCDGGRNLELVNHILAPACFPDIIIYFPKPKPYISF